MMVNEEDKGSGSASPHPHVAVPIEEGEGGGKARTKEGKKKRKKGVRFEPEVEGHRSKRSAHSEDQMHRHKHSSGSQGSRASEQLQQAFQAQSEINPFVNNTPPWTWKIVLMSVLVTVFLLPLRLVVFVPSIVMAWLLDAIAQLGHYNEEYPMSHWRQRIVNCSSYFWRAWLFSLSMQKIEMVGAPASRSEAPICIVNHTSFLDIFIMYSFKRFMFIGKKEVTKIPFGREIIRAGQTLLFDRTNKASAALMKEKILKRATDVFDGNVPQWPTLVIFPESTCTNGTALITFKRGAFSSGVRVQPVTIKYHWTTADPCKVYGGGPGIGVILFRLLTSLHNGATVHFMDVYHPSAEEKKDDLLFAENARILMAKSLNVPVTNHSYGDVQLLLKAGKMKIRRRSLKDFNVEMHTLQEILNAKCSVDQFKYFMKKFHEAAGKSGELTKQGFFDVLKMKQNPITERIFELFDIDSDGVLQFKEFMAGIALLYYSHDKDFLADIVSEKSESGRLYFDENQFLFASKMKGFAFSRRKHYPNPVVSDQDLSRRSGDFQDVSLRSDASESLRGADNNNNTQEEGEVQEQKVWWTQDELLDYIQSNPDFFSWIQNPQLQSPSRKK